MSDVDDIKSRLDIVKVIGESVALKKAGRNFKGLCPFHSEKSPSFMVSPERQSYHCFGCEEGGDIFDFVMKREHVDFAEALRMLAQRAGVTLKGYDAKAGKAKQRLFDANEQTAAYFVAALAHAAGKTARDYLKSRGLKEKTIKQFRVGFAPDDYTALVEALKKKGFSEQELTDAGVAGRGARGPYARFRGRLMIPITDTQGSVRGFTGRILDEEAKDTGKYVNTPETEIYHKGKLVFALDQAKDAIVEADSVVLVEGQMDVLSAHQAGTTNIVAVSGTGMTEEQLRQLTRFTKTVVLALDNDEAGRKASLRILELIGDRDVELKMVDLGEHKDPDELITKDAKAWAECVKNAEPVIDFLLKRALAEHESPYDRQAIRGILDEVLPALRFRQALDQDFYSEQLANTLGIERDSIKQRLKELTGADQPAKTAIETVAAEVAGRTEHRKTPEDLVSERMLGLVLTTPHLAPKLEELDQRIFSEAYRQAADTLKKQYNRQTASDIRALLDVCNLAAAEYEPMTEEERAAEFDRLYARLKALWVRQYQPKLMAAIKRAEASGDISRRNKLMEEYITLTKKVVHG